MSRNLAKLNLRNIIFLLLGTLFVLLLYFILHNISYRKALYKTYTRVLYDHDNKTIITSKVSLKHLLAVSIDIAERGGVELKAVRKLVDVQKVRKGKSDPFYEGNVKSYCAMMYGFKKIHPEIKVISEKEDCSKINLDDDQLPRGENTEVKTMLESVDEKVLSEQIAVWVEPLDCFHEYKKNLLPCVATMVCVAVNGKPVIGVIHHPFQNLTVWGWVGHGITSQLKIGKTFFKEWTTEPEIVVSRTEARLGADFAARAFGGEETITLAGGEGFKLLQVLQGLVSAYIHLSFTKKWDICAGDALLQTVGGNVTTLKGKPISYAASDDVDNKGGLLATLFKHDFFLDKFKNV
ncbi:putative inositol monophosphatase 3 isoform X1 [Limulus polyphemus]|uniref:inositol-phosphate phosphatase n=1 Tax=Limulus polyphemus TaxID=6850 RepID=A0ABM1TJZ1_LIMPO|nr:putative inositol monophosphatase 3 isoform X1 [Limulus polyphemus]